MLQDGKPLSFYNMGANSLVLVTRGGGGGAGPSGGSQAPGSSSSSSSSVNEASARAARLERLKRAAERLAGRDGGGSGGYELSLENQAGSSVKFSADDQKALVMGLTMHGRGKASMGKGDWPGALEELLLSEESFGLCAKELCDGIDNVGMLMLDIVWCMYRLQDGRRLAVAGERLARARVALSRAWGPGLERARRLHGSDVCPELGTLVRLEAMEGVVAYYARDLEKASASLASAQAKLGRLAVSDEQLAGLQAMGYSLKDSRRALRFAGGDMPRALDFVQREIAAREAAAANERKRRAWARERRRYGRTATGRYVEVEPCDVLADMGYERPLAAEALRVCDNDATAALEALLDLGRRDALALSAALTAAARDALALPAALTAAARAGRRGRREAAAAAEAAAGAAGAGAAAGAGGAAAALAAALAAAATAGASDAAAAARGGAAAAGGAQPTEAGTGVGKHGGGGEGDREGGGEGGSDGSGSGSDDDGSGGGDAEMEERDAEMEAELVAGVRGQGQDAMDAYDMELDDEAEVVATFRAMLASEQE
ncbi:hypothetical protein FOA52_012325 [Chlamydomonas sp. UWO 241]|nr:hypothetical protein FOA52_012325 [Chlamydomonas sp. UWO 241]